MKILIAGDFCPYYRISKMIANADYSFFNEIQEYTKSVDYSIINFECPVVDGEVKPIFKCGPALRTERNAVSAMKSAGFDCVTLANNHFRDFGDDGCKMTINELKNQQMDYVGGGMNITEAQKILYKEFGSERVAIVNFCENEFSIATDTSAGAAPIDTVDNYNQITEARKNADYVLVIIHGGHEYYQLPSPRMKKLYRHYIAIGADAVVNHHQHCYSGYELYNGKPIIYGLGNCCFDWEGERNSIWNNGYLAIIDTENNRLSTIPYNQCDEYPNITILQGAAKDIFSTDITRLNAIISDDNQLSSHFNQWVNDKKRSVSNLLFPYKNRYVNAIVARGYLPIRSQPVRNRLALLNYVNCEAHRDIVIKVLSDLPDNK